MEQFAFDFMLPPPPPAMPIAAALIAAGYATGDYDLQINRHISNYDDVPAPSRLYQFPIEYFSPNLDGIEGLYLSHPGLADFPFVKRVSEAIGLPIDARAEDEFGRPFCDLAEWWHAVDLMDDKNWRHLMDTQHLTTRDDLLNALSFHLETGDIKTSTARTILGMLGQLEPIDRSVTAILGDGISPWLINIGGNGKPVKCPKDWALNVKRFDNAAWMLIHGIEDGWLHMPKSKHLSLTAKAVSARAEMQIGQY
ncbi:hypothetical protein ONR75_18575 [Rhodopseudomonas sp. P2A-2r]|uniref:hypothetical protein n=1 Tax=Rhodopseudomonas sp. P2A-2r TaxID=2991972 RepID=UPI002234D71A|nr:hypothetical protein [Rhodopseudomonas sp. P2A-2r]UZE47010.1 hypothetical protein ONR75_18575 [Rhodopseudomonas sp. P2A-2r]